MNLRNRSEGWKHAKISGHSNESDITNKINKDKLYREKLDKIKFRLKYKISK